MTIKPAVLGEIVLRALHAEGFAVTSTRVDAPPNPGGYTHAHPSSTPPAETFPNRELTKPMPLLSDKDKPKPPPIPRTESAAQRSLVVHYRRIVGEEGQALTAIEEELRELRKDPKVVRYIEALEAHRVGTERRDRAAQDLGYTICKDFGDPRT